MRALLIHADFMEFEVKKATPVAEEIDDDMRRGRMDEVLVAFLTVERADEGNVTAVAKEATADILAIMERVGAARLMLYPYAHLSPDLSDPATGIKMLRSMESMAKDLGVEVERGPFGWYKTFTISCKGHPLSELSRDYEGKEEEKAHGEERFYVLTPDGDMVDVESYQGGDPCFREMLDKEALKKEAPSAGEPKYLRLCRKFGIQWESMSDVGHMSFTSDGALMFDLVADYSTQIVNEMGIPLYMVKGTNMFSLDEPPVREHAELFGDRLYQIKTDKHRFVMRYAACHQQFAMMRNWNISYRQLPFGAFEVADSYRLEQSGETMLCFRTRRLNMPDLHVICRDNDQAQENFLTLDGRIYDEVHRADQDYEMLINLSSQQAFEENRDMILDILKAHGKPALIHFYPEGINYYWTVNIEYHILDDIGRAREIGTVQIDVGNAERFGITYADEDGKEQHPVILHSAVIGTIERYLYMLLDRAVQMEATGQVGHLPMWITPEQVRLCTVSENHVAGATVIADRIQAAGIRVSLDDRGETVGKKIRAAKQSWASHVIVIGDRELEAEELKVYVRSENTDRVMTVDALVEEIRAQISCMPFRPLYQPRELSRRVQF